MTSLLHAARGDSNELLKRAVDLLRAVAEEACLAPSTHQRVTAFLRDVEAPDVDPADAPTVLERPRLLPLRLTIHQHIVLERALRSPHLSKVFDGGIHTFLLVAARGFPYVPAPSCSHVDTAGAKGERTIAFKAAELAEVRANAVAAGAPSAEEFVLGCGFSWLAVLREKWPNDPDLNAHVDRRKADITPVEIYRFPSKPTRKR